MEIIKSQFRKNVLSYCCQKDIYLDTIECSGCLEQTTFLIKEPTAFHKYLIDQCRNQENPEVYLTQILRGMIVKDQNPQAFELLDWVDIGEKHYDASSLKRVSLMLLDTHFITTRIDAVNSIPKVKTIESTDEEIEYSCCGNDISSQDVKRCPTCGEMN